MNVPYILYIKSFCCLLFGSLFSTSFISKDVSFNQDVLIGDSFFSNNADINIENLSSFGTINIAGKIDFLVNYHEDNVLAIGVKNKNIQTFILGLPSCVFPKKILCLDENDQVGFVDALSFLKERTVEVPVSFDSVIVNEINTKTDKLIIQNLNNAENSVDIIIGNSAADIFFYGNNLYLDAPIDSHAASIVFKKPVLLDKDFLIKSLSIDYMTVSQTFDGGVDLNVISHEGALGGTKNTQSVLIEGQVFFDDRLTLKGYFLWNGLEPIASGLYPHLAIDASNQVGTTNTSFLVSVRNSLVANNIYVNNLFTNDLEGCSIGGNGDVFFTVEKGIKIDNSLTIIAPTVFLKKDLFLNTMQVDNISKLTKLTFATLPSNGMSLSCKTSVFVIDSSIDQLTMSKNQLGEYTNFIRGYPVLEKNAADNSLSLRVVKTATAPRYFQKQAYDVSKCDDATSEELFSLNNFSDLCDLSLLGLGLARVISLYAELEKIKHDYRILLAERKEIHTIYAQKKEKLMLLKKLS